MLHDLAETRRVLETQGIDVVRLIFTDLLGITRSKDLLVSQLERSAAHGPAFCQGTWVTTTRGGVLDAGTGSFGDGLPDMVASLDTDTIRPIRVYTTGAHVDPDGHYLHLLRMLDQLNIGAFAGNHEFCPSQYEINLWHSEAMDAADRTFLFKTAIKDVTAMRGILGTFLGKPWSDEGGSGFHLHFSVTDAEGVNLMHDGDGALSGMARQMIAGVIEHADAIAAFTNPTVNAYKRLGPDTLAPYRSNWGYDNRSTMIRIPPERGQGTRLELRIGDGSANPYVVIAVVLAAALDGIPWPDR